ncbi:MAG: hypothetical protein IT239_00420, partial [Bacteroidia bacterium]|nr:hypothetical protein [Bacteroidia bacterium]
METLSKKNISETVNEIAQKIVSAEATNNFESLRKNAYDSLVSLGLPNKKNEEYKYANPEKFFKNGLSPAIASQANIKEVVEKYRSVFSNAQIATLLNGFVVKEFTDDSFQSSNSFSQIGSVALTDKDYFAALNTAMFPEALVINASVEQAEIRIIINIVSLPDAISSPRIFINAPKNANIQVIEITEVLPTASNSVCN